MIDAGWIATTADTPAASAADVIVLLAWLSAAAALAAVAFWLIRRWLNRDDRDQGVVSGFTLADLRQLHREGHLTDEQFAAAKAGLIARGLASMGGLDEGSEADGKAKMNTKGLSDEAENAESDASSDKMADDEPGDDASPKRDE